ncbi:YhcN/YlaJ family sporulation lipoprotein [Bacillus aquiflavi]|uniref:Sporulation protein n=1 Tax=Bacillus aquiflavi TaxID=2672567 RepID=A0A6B3VR58_9BACI|nr:YhcN/YlaJ family sporulation lipoprotein [Bacillus aquiflavi]MBA4536412.1 YhcN/YlaJ family sporulation lipoprotein [Bacillus aquiflavi]NEY80780.1 sporulation protein [Bacillus aquiflavi]
MIKCVRHFSVILILTFIFTGCQQKEDDESRLALIKTTDPSPTVVEKTTYKDAEIAEKIKETVLSKKQIYDVAIVKGDSQILVAYKVKHLYRFQMKKLEKSVKNQLKKQFPKEKFTVSSDYKVFLEAVKMNEKMKDADYDEKKASKRLKTLIKMTKELT